MSQQNGDPAASRRCRSNLHTSTVGNDVLAHDREAKTRAGSVLNPDAAAKALEHRLALSDRDTWTRIVNGDDSGADSDRNRGGSVQERVLDEIAKRPFESCWITGKRCGLAH